VTHVVMPCLQDDVPNLTCCPNIRRACDKIWISEEHETCPKRPESQRCRDTYDKCFAAVRSLPLDHTFTWQHRHTTESFCEEYNHILLV
jgi:hypothetical protein